MGHLDPLLEEFLVATAFLGFLAVLIAFAYWAVTGLSPWPGLVIGEAIGCGTGAAILAAATPKRPRRPPR